MAKNKITIRNFFIWPFPVFLFILFYHLFIIWYNPVFYNSIMLFKTKKLTKDQPFCFQPYGQND